MAREENKKQITELSPLTSEQEKVIFEMMDKQNKAYDRIVGKIIRAFIVSLLFNLILTLAVTWGVFWASKTLLNKNNKVSNNVEIREEGENYARIFDKITIPLALQKGEDNQKCSENFEE